VGTLRGFDDYVNMVLEEVTEYDTAATAVAANGGKAVATKLDSILLNGAFVSLLVPGRCVLRCATASYELRAARGTFFAGHLARPARYAPHVQLAGGCRGQLRGSQARCISCRAQQVGVHMCTCGRVSVCVCVCDCVQQLCCHALNVYSLTHSYATRIATTFHARMFTLSYAEATAAAAERVKAANSGSAPSGGGAALSRNALSALSKSDSTAVGAARAPAGPCESAYAWRLASTAASNSSDFSFAR
ncbi:hypothetical protein EON67_06665, partial [archaeon]